MNSSGFSRSIGKFPELLIHSVMQTFRISRGFFFLIALADYIIECKFFILHFDACNLVFYVVAAFVYLIFLLHRRVIFPDIDIYRFSLLLLLNVVQTDTTAAYRLLHNLFD